MEKPLAAQYLAALGSRAGRTEAAGAEGSTDLSPPGIGDRLDRIRRELMFIVAHDHGDSPEMRDAVDALIGAGRTALSRLAAEGEAAAIESPELVASLEVIVREDGSRPAFQIVNGRPRPGADLENRWYQRLAASDHVAKAVAAVGRINDPGRPGPGYHGTGFLVTPDLVVTNRHVAQAIAPLVSGDGIRNGVLPVREGVFFDHGHEWGGVESMCRRPILEIVFAGPRVIDGKTPLDHTRLDLAVLRLGPLLDQTGPRVEPVAIAIDPFVTDRHEEVVVVGYPARPSEGVRNQMALVLQNADKALTLIYGNRFGYKRAAPGEIVRSPGESPEDQSAWRVDHDASTLGGNSGSCVIDFEFAPCVTALHYGGEWYGGEAGRINWAHALVNTLDEAGLEGFRSRTLRELASAEGMSLVNVQQ
jgi:hypothetical protein